MREYTPLLEGHLIHLHSDNISQPPNRKFEENRDENFEGSTNFDTYRLLGD